MSEFFFTSAAYIQVHFRIDFYHGSKHYEPCLKQPLKKDQNKTGIQDQ